MKLFSFTKVWGVSKKFEWHLNSKQLYYRKDMKIDISEEVDEVSKASWSGISKKFSV